MKIRIWPHLERTHIIAEAVQLESRGVAGSRLNALHNNEGWGQRARNYAARMPDTQWRFFHATTDIPPLPREAKRRHAVDERAS